MKNRVYYGQYSLKHWIDLILSGNIVLPEYQRYFVWDKDDVLKLIETFKKNLFVPPVTIGSYTNHEGSTENLILDGQQRLTSLLLSFLNLYPNKEKFRAIIENLADDNDDNQIEESDIEEPDNNIGTFLEWNFKQILKHGKTKDAILQSIENLEYYDNLNLTLYNDFFESNYLGFSFLVPQGNISKIQQKYYSSVFRNINASSGNVPLLAQESRASLYYLNDDLKGFFSPNQPNIKKLSINIFNTTAKADFVRFLALLSQYAKDLNTIKIARGKKSTIEKYYEEYIYSVVGEETSNIFKDFQLIFQNTKDYETRYSKLNTLLEELKIPYSYNSIIDMDLYLFGLIYEVVFEDNSIDVSKKSELNSDLQNKIGELKSSDTHKKTPSALKYLKLRIASSIEIYSKYSIK